MVSIFIFAANRVYISTFIHFNQEGKKINAFLFLFFVIAESLVFQTMLNGKFNESTEGEISIEDFDFDVVEQMVEWLYVGKAPRMREMADDLLRISEKVNLLQSEKNF